MFGYGRLNPTSREVSSDVTGFFGSVFGNVFPTNTDSPFPLDSPIGTFDLASVISVSRTPRTDDCTSGVTLLLSDGS